MLQNYSFYSISAIFYYGFLCKNTHSHISTSTLQLFMCASDVKYFAIFFLFSQYYSLTLHSQRFATLPVNTLLGSYAIKREWGESPRLSRSCEPPLSTGANERTTEAMHLRAECVGMAGMPYPPIKLFAGCVGMAGMPYPPMLWEGVRVWAASQKTCRNSFADGVIAVRLADWARMTATLTLYK